MISHNTALRLLRLSLGIIFFWFGVLKLFNVSPALEILQKALPVLGQSQLFMFLIAFLEILIGISFLVNKLDKTSAIVMEVYLLITTFAILATQGFNPRFPVLSLEGEFAIKNLGLMAAGLILIVEKEDSLVDSTQGKPSTHSAGSGRAK